VLRRIFSVAVKKKLCPINPCSAVEFPVRVQRSVPAPLFDVVGAVQDRGSRSRIPAECDPDHHRL
jgi:hypothetical protein